MRIKKFNVNEEGLNHFFGPLEAKIMEIIWTSEGLSIKDVHEKMLSDSEISYNAVMTVMNRLLEKGHMKRYHMGKGRTRSYIYQAVETKEQFLTEQTKNVTHGLINEFGDLVVNHMIDALDHADPVLLQRLEEKLNAMKKRKKP